MLLEVYDFTLSEPLPTLILFSAIPAFRRAEPCGDNLNRFPGMRNRPYRRVLTAATMCGLSRRAIPATFCRGLPHPSVVRTGNRDATRLRSHRNPGRARQ